MEEAIRNFAKQFEWEPKIENAEKWRKFGKFLIAGMGGSHLQGDVLLALIPSLDFLVHADYGLPQGISKDRLIIASSYSGNTEETINAFEQAVQQGLPLVASSTGGKLLALAKEQGVAYIQVPDTGIQPRSALGFTLKALLKITGQEEMIKEATGLAAELSPEEFEGRGKTLAQTLYGKVPVIYSSARNYAIAYNWKIKFNETGKIPAFYNVFPELNHNEMAGFDAMDSTKELSKKFYFILLKDKEDHERIQKRMEVVEKLYRDRGLPAEVVQIEGASRLYKIFSSLVLADWTAYYTAKEYRTEPEQVPIIEEFKKQIAQ